MQHLREFIAFFAEEWLMSLALTGLIGVSLYTQNFPHYQSSQLIPIFLLWALFVAVKGVEHSGLLTFIAAKLEKGTLLAPKLVTLSFLFSIVLSIDVTLVAMLPLVLSMQIKEKNYLVLLVAFTAHVGAALTPFGTPQNLFIFSFYHLEILPFIRVIAPFSFALFALFLLVAFFIPVTRHDNLSYTPKSVRKEESILYLLVLSLVIMAVLRICPWYTGAIAIVTALLFDRKTLRVDYPLLLTFVLFLGLANELKNILAHYLQHPVHLFLLSSFLSQFISNVPTTLLLHQFTPEWEALLWGTNVGGFGTPVAALANLITYRIYASCNDKEKNTLFLTQMIFWGFLVYGVAVGLYFAIPLFSEVSQG